MPGLRKSDAAEPDAAERQCQLTLTAEARAIGDKSHQRVPPQIEKQRCKSPSSGNALNPAESALLGRIGLLYTDAAHAVLEDRDVAYYMQHTIERPLP